MTGTNAQWDDAERQAPAPRRRRSARLIGARLERLAAALGDRYLNLQVLGRGGMATVFRALDVRHDRSVAIKVLHPELSATLATNRFLQEIRITARLRHPHILALFDSGEADGLLYFVMPFVDGRSLRVRLSRDGELAIDDALAITQQVAGALDHAHRHGIVHRDVKPENILLEDGQAFLSDFGVALAIGLAGGERLTQSGFTPGTPAYMSPEQADGEHDLDGRSDVYTLACVLYEMLCGEPPFTGATRQAVLARHVSERVPSIRIVRPEVPRAMQRVITRALAKAPADRYPTAVAFVRALEAAAGTDGADTVPPVAVRRRGLRTGSESMLALLGLHLLP